MTLVTNHAVQDSGHVADHNAIATQVNANTAAITANLGLPVGAAGATQPTRYVGRWSTVGAPVTGTFAVGDFGFDSANTVQVCTVAGTPGTWAASAASGVTQILASGDTTGATDGPAINAAITTVSAAGGGIIDIVGTCWTNVPILWKPGVHLRGHGWLVSSINLATTANCSVIVADTSCYFGKISNLTIDGWKENQGAGAWRGIDLSGVSATHGGAPASKYVGGLGLTIEDVLVRSTKSTAVYVDTNGAVETRLTNVYTYGADNDGYFLSGSDIFVLNCTAGGSLGHGFNITAQGTRLSNCKSWQSGWSWSRTFTSTYPTGGVNTAHGYNVAGQNCTLTACEGQDNAGVGLNMGGDCCQAFGFNADANLTGAYQLYINARRCVVEGIVGNGTSHGTPSPWVVNIWNSSAVGNKVRVSWPNNTAGATAGIASGAKQYAPQNDIVIGVPDAQYALGWQSTVTPDPFYGSPFFTLAGNTTIANPATDRYVPGMKFRVTVVQDGTGSRTVTWGSDFKVATAVAATASQATSWEFECMNGVWVERGKAGLTGVTVPNVAPGQVGTVTATPGNAQVVLAWSAPNNGGSAITDYVVQYRTTTGPGAWNTFADGVSASTGATVTGLTNNTSYDFQVAAVNAIGQGAYSAAVSATPFVVTTYASDAFTGADSTTSISGRTSDTGQVWSVLSGSFGISTNQAYNSTGGSREIAVLDAAVSDCVIYLDVATVGNGGIAFRTTDVNNKWLVREAILEKVVAGTPTSVSSWASLVNGDTLKVVLSGSSITVSKITAGVTTQIGAASDAFNSTATKHGICSTFSSVGRYDNFFVKSA